MFQTIVHCSGFQDCLSSQIEAEIGSWILKESMEHVQGCQFHILTMVLRVLKVVWTIFFSGEEKIFIICILENLAFLPTPSFHSTMVQNRQESRRYYWATSLSVYMFVHSFACSALLALFARSAALTHSLTHSGARGT